MLSDFVVDPEVAKESKCFHCGQACEETWWLDEKAFCCTGCKTVYEILCSNDLCEYYRLDDNPGAQLKYEGEAYSYLDDQTVRKKLTEFDSGTFAKVKFVVPAIHCISCIWLLENLQKINNGILRSEVNFARKSVTIDFNPGKIKISEVADALSAIGYAPQINLEKLESEKPLDNTSLIVKLAIAGFCFGNVMLFSFPEYLGLGSDGSLKQIFSWLNLALSLPVFLYSDWDYFKSALKTFRQKQINIDVPIAAGLLALFFRSAYDIITGFGPGYLDSFTGLVFFLLIGRWFQSKTYESLAFDRDFKSYFPLAIHKLIDSEFKPVVIYDLEIGDRIRIRNMEVVPADCTLQGDLAYIDYSFVTGESKPVKAKKGDVIYAGGRLIGEPVILAVEKKTSQSYLTSLWNHEAFRKRGESRYQKIIDRAARRFTWIVLGVAAVTALYWYTMNPPQMWLVLTSVLMVACPCALALAAPFTYGSMLRVFGRHQFYLKNVDVIERLASVDAVVFDKTGTVTHGKSPEIKLIGHLTAEEYKCVKLLTSFSTHLLSNYIHQSIHDSTENLIVKDFKEFPGKGIEGTIGGKKIKIGSAAFTAANQVEAPSSSQVFILIDNDVKGWFLIHSSVRKNIKEMIQRLGRKCVALLSGDNSSDEAQMKTVFGSSAEFLFNQSPHDKLHYICDLQQKGKRVLMVGDGLNDSGALKQSDVGVAVTDDAGIFTPACDGILQGNKVGSLDKFLKLARTSSVILKTGFAISFLYNAIALTFAVTGHLTPLVAAILMPISSISVVSFSSLAVNVTARKIISTR